MNDSSEICRREEGILFLILSCSLSSELQLQQNNDIHSSEQRTLSKKKGQSQILKYKKLQCQIMSFPYNYSINYILYSCRLRVYSLCTIKLPQSVSCYCEGKKLEFHNTTGKAAISCLCHRNLA